MPVLYVNLNKQECLKKEPYASFMKKFEIIRDELDGEQIELRVGGRDECFTNGFYVDHFFYKNPRLRLNFALIPSPDDPARKTTLIRAIYSYEGADGYDFAFYHQRTRDIKKRAPYYYLPGATHFEFSSQLDDEYKLIFDALVEEGELVPKVCCSLISLIISIFSLDN